MEKIINLEPKLVHCIHVKKVFFHEKVHLVMKKYFLFGIYTPDSNFLEYSQRILKPEKIIFHNEFWPLFKA